MYIISIYFKNINKINNDILNSLNDQNEYKFKDLNDN